MPKFQWEATTRSGEVRRGVVEFQHARGHRGASRELRRTQAPGAGNEHIPVAVGADEQRLQHTVPPLAEGSGPQLRPRVMTTDDLTEVFHPGSLPAIDTDLA